MHISKSQRTVLWCVLAVILASENTLEDMEPDEEEFEGAAYLNKPPKDSLEQNEISLAMESEYVKKRLISESNETSKEEKAKKENEIHNVIMTKISGFCTDMNNKKPKCKGTERFRTIDGTCNNKKNLQWGKNQGFFERMLPQNYTRDNITDGAPRRSRSGNELPNVRDIVVNVHSTWSSNVPDVTGLLMTFGQFASHEINKFGLMRRPRNCCEIVNTNENCFKIVNAKNDIAEKVERDREQPKKCSRFSRGVMFSNGMDELCEEKEISWIRKLSIIVTPYIDGSNVYGSDNLTESIVRGGMEKGFLATSPVTHNSQLKPLPPMRDDGVRLIAGDRRADATPMLMSIHTLFIREHNRIAEQLATINRGWDGDRIYQETRRIVGAILQHVIYNEYLPVILGPKSIKKFKLELSSGFFDGYDESMNAGISVEFSAAAMRFGHSQIQQFTLHGSSGLNSTETFKLLGKGNQLVNAPDPHGVDGYLRGMLRQSVQKSDNKFSKSVRDDFFRRPNGISGDDISSLNLLRGRDFGLQPWMEIRKWCNLKTMTTFSELDDIIPSWIAHKYESLYEDVWDIDVYTGGLAERHEEGLVGPTFSCIIGNQFSRLRTGDRFWYENSDQVNSFTLSQIQEIKKFSLAKLICENSDAIEKIARNVFKAGQEEVPCVSIPDINLEKWAP